MSGVRVQHCQTGEMGWLLEGVIYPDANPTDSLAAFWISAADRMEQEIFGVPEEGYRTLVGYWVSHPVSPGALSQHATGPDDPR